MTEQRNTEQHGAGRNNELKKTRAQDQSTKTGRHIKEKKAAQKSSDEGQDKKTV